MSDDVNVVVGITGNAQGGQVVKKSLDDIALSNDKATAASKRLEVQNQKNQNAVTKLAAETKKADAATISGTAAIQRATASLKQSESATLAASAAQAKAQNAMRATELQASRLAIQQEKLNLQQKELSESVAGLNARFDSFSGGVRKLAAVLAVLGLADLAKDAINTGNEFVQLSNKMKAATKDSDISAQSLQFIRDVSDKLGLSLLSAGDGFAGFAASALRSGLTFGQTKTIFEDVAMAATGLQLPAQNVGLIFKALDQIAGKGVVSLEEIKGQLGDSLPGATEIAAKAMNMTTSAFIQAVSQGEILAYDFLPKFGAAIKDELGGSATEAANSLTAQTNRMKNAFANLQNEFSKNGAGDAYKDMIVGLKDLFESEGFLTAIRNISAAIGGVAIYVGLLAEKTNNLLGITDSGKLAKINAEIKRDDVISNGYKDDFFGVHARNTVKLQKEKDDLLASMKARNDALLASQQTQKKQDDDTQFDYDIGLIADPDDYTLGSGNQGKTKAQKKADAAAAKKEVSEQNKLQNELKTAINGSRTEQEKLNDEIANLEKLKGVATTAEQMDLLNRGIQNTQVELDKLKIKIQADSPVGKAFKDFADTVDKSMSSAFQKLFEKGGGGFKGMLESWKASFKSMLAEMAYTALVRPVIMSIVGSVGSTAGLSANTIGSILGNQSTAGSMLGNLLSGSTGGTSGASGGGFSLSSIGSAASALLNGGLYSNTLGGIGSGIGNLLSGQAYGAMGPSAAASIGGGAFGNLGYGAIGGLGANLLGLGSQNSTVNLISGGLGSLAGGAIGTSIGSILGMAGGPVGAIVGSFLGTAIGGLFGGKSAPGLAIDRGFSFENGSYSQARASQDGSTAEQQSNFNNLSSTITSKVDEFAKLIGGTITSAPVSIISQTRREGIRVAVAGVTPGYVGNNNDKPQFSDLQSAVNYALTSILGATDFSGVSDDLMKVVKTSLSKNSGDLDAAVADIQFAQQILGEMQTPADTAAKAMQDINDQFDAMISKAADLGLPLDKLNDYFAKTREEALGLVKAQQAGYQSMQQMKEAFQSFFNIQDLGANSTLSKKDQLGIYQGNFDSLLKTAQGGDLSVTQQLLSAANDLITASRTVNASSVSFANLSDFVKSSITEIARQAGVPGYAVGTGSAATGIAMVGERGRELVQMQGGERVYTAGETSSMMAVSGNVALDIVKSNAKVVNILAENLEDNKDIRLELRALRKNLERLANKMAVGA